MAHPDRGDEIRKKCSQMLEELKIRRANKENAIPISSHVTPSVKPPISMVTMRRKTPTDEPVSSVEATIGGDTPRISPHVTMRRKAASEKSQRPATVASSSMKEVPQPSKPVSSRPVTSAVSMEPPIVQNEAPSMPMKQAVPIQLPSSEHPIRRTQSATARPQPSTEKPVQSNSPQKPFARSCSSQRMGKRIKKHTPKKIIVNGIQYNTVAIVGAGGSCTVYSALSESDDFGLVAVKVVDLLKYDESSRKSFINEIKLLESLQGNKHVIKMHAHEIKDNYIFVVLEHGDSDFQQYIKKAEINPHMIKFFWKEMLECVKVIHDKNIVHSDLKPANFLLVKGFLKLIDFGIAVHIENEFTSAHKENQSGTVNFMSPEMLTPQANLNQQVKIPLVADVWSLGCILYFLLYGKLPYQYAHNLYAKIEAIKTSATEFGPCSDPQLLDVLKKCFVKDYRQRATVDELLAHPYLTSEPGRHSTSLGTTFDSSNTTEESLLKAIAEINANKTPRSAAKSIVRMIRGEGDEGSVLSFNSS